jgi:hypothetical protein
MNASKPIFIYTVSSLEQEDRQLGLVGSSKRDSTRGVARRGSQFTVHSSWGVAREPVDVHVVR